MAKKISGAEYPLCKIFTSDFEYHIPSYQRPYAWTEEETGTLFSDLYDFYTSVDEDDYFLGSIVLIKEDNKPKSEVIDGQQRLTTLTILLSVIASRFSGQDQQELAIYIREPGNKFQGLASAPRLFLRERDKDFFAKYVQDLKIDELLALDEEQQDTEAKLHIIRNAREIKKKLDDTFGNDLNALSEFVQFLVQRCYLIAVSTPSQESAYRVFSVMNSRGMDLLPIDIIKAEVIGKINPSDREKYNFIWEDLEGEASRAGFNELFMHIRSIFAKQKAKRSLLEEFKEYVIDKVNDPVKLIDKYIKPYSNAYTILKNKDYKSSQDATEVNKSLMWLNKIDNSDWMPASIKFLSGHMTDHNYVTWFFTKMERLASYLTIISADVNTRIRRYSAILEEMEENPSHNMSEPLQSIELTPNEIKYELEVLGGDIYYMSSKRRNYIILRLDSFVSDGAASYDPRVLTIEHVLPQTVNQSSEWAELWPNEEEQKQWRHKIANLVPLARRINSAAQNYDFEEKKQKYFTSAAGTSSYALTTQVLNEKTWTPTLVEQRQKDLIAKFASKWNLVYSEDDIVQESKKQVHRPPLDFFKMGYSIGDKLIYKKDSNIIVTIIDNNKVEYKGKAVSLSPLTKGLRRLPYYVAPGQYWIDESGRVLSDVYNETYTN